MSSYPRYQAAHECDSQYQRMALDFINSSLKGSSICGWARTVRFWRFRFGVLSGSITPPLGFVSGGGAKSFRSNLSTMFGATTNKRVFTQGNIAAFPTEIDFDHSLPRSNGFLGRRESLLSDRYGSRSVGWNWTTPRSFAAPTGQSCGGRLPCMAHVSRALAYTAAAVLCRKPCWPPLRFGAKPLACRLCSTVS